MVPSGSAYGKLGVLGLIVAILLVVSGCERQKEEEAVPGSEATTETAPRPFAVDPTQAATIEGQVLFTGTVPAQTELQMAGNPECNAMHTGTIYAGDVIVNDRLAQNAFVYVKEGLENYTFEAPSQPVVVDNLRCMYSPRVVGVQVHQPIELHNSDPTLHNIHSYPQKNPGWNLGLPFQGMKTTKKFSQPDVMVTLKCDVHPWMKGFIGVVPHPYFQVTGPDGSFKFEGLPPGNYTLEAWHERFGVQTITVSVDAQQTQEVAFTFSSVS